MVETTRDIELYYMLSIYSPNSNYKTTGGKPIVPPVLLSLFSTETSIWQLHTYDTFDLCM